MSKFKKFISRFFLIDDTPQKVAGGAALGMFMGIFPGEGVLSTLFFATIFRLNRLAATAGVLAFNMWTTLLLLTPSAVIGGFLFRKNYGNLVNEFNQVYHLGTVREIILFSLSFFSKSALPILSGFLITAGIVSIGFYFLLLFILKRKRIGHLNDAINVKR
jgi:uncharacterized protein (DUF2062 family)